MRYETLVTLSEQLQALAAEQRPNSEEWAVFQDAADALLDAADLLRELAERESG